MQQKIFIFILFLLGSFGTMAQGTQQKEVSPEEIMKMFVNHLAQKIVLTKNQKDSIAATYLRFNDDIQKYHAENNAKVMAFMTKSRDDQVKSILHDNLKFDNYLLFLEDMKKQRPPEQGPPQQQRQGPGQQGPGQQDPIGNGRGL